MAKYEELRSRMPDLGSILKEISEQNCLEAVIVSCLLKKYAVSTAKQYAPKYKEDVIQMLKNLSKLMELMERAGLDPSWMIATLSLAIQDITVQNVAIGLKIPIQIGDRFKSTPELLDDMEWKAEKVGVKTTDLKIAKVFSEDYRNGVIHRGTAVNERRALEILQATINLLEALSNLRLSYHNNA